VHNLAKMPIRAEPVIELPDQSGRTAVVTGANSGLGLEAAVALAGAGAHVLLASRSPERLEAALREVRSRAPGASAGSVTLDLSSLASVREAASTILAAVDGIDLLIDNAGVMAVPRSETQDGFERQIGTNHLGHFAFTGLLLPALLGRPGSRVVVVTSFMRLVGRIDFDDLHGRAHYGRWKAYSQSKLANILFMTELERRLRATPGAETIAVAAHPGYAATNLQKGESTSQNFVLSLGNTLFAQSARGGAWPILYAATAPEVRGGELYGPSQLRLWGRPSRERLDGKSRDAQVARRLWEISVAETGVSFPELDPGSSEAA
jgi:NAD(P)-dependent dehydrogenase (short-subunit alcohol dehydrogenase family)